MKLNFFMANVMTMVQMPVVSILRRNTTNKKKFKKMKSENAELKQQSIALESKSTSEDSSIDDEQPAEKDKVVKFNQRSTKKSKKKD